MRWVEEVGRVRVIVVGAGVAGASCAYTAASLGAEVVLVDAAMAGRATAAGAGIICPWTSSLSDDPVWCNFACAAVRHYGPLLAELAECGEKDVGYRRVGALSLAGSHDGQQAIIERMLAQRATAPEIGEVTAVSGAGARCLFPPLRGDRPAVFIEGAARVDGRLLAAALARAASVSGAVVMSGQARLAWHGDRAVGVTVGGQLVEADAVVAAAGAWTPAFLGPAGVRVTVTPQRGQIAHFALPSAATDRWPVILPVETGHYLVAFDDGRVVAGATRETGSGFDHRVTAGGLAEVLSRALATAPGLVHGTHLETRVGLRPMSPDDRPLLGPVTGMDGVVVATGLGPTGLTLGPYTGAIAARIALGQHPAIDLAPLNPLRLPAPLPRERRPAAS
jgi:D-amino-acid dehydrogenase